MSGYGRVIWVGCLVVAAACGGSVSSGTGGDAGGADATGSGSGSGSGSGGSGSGASSGGTSSGGEGGTPTDGGGPPKYDGTTGKACSSDADCRSATGPNVARCSTTVFAPEQYYPTPVCILPTCSPVSGSTAVHYCDGPDDPSSPGICAPYGTSGGGICLPKCTYDKNGGAAVGCTGKDVCNTYPAATQGGVGYCWAGCTRDADCPAGQKCQTDQGLCVEGVAPPTKAFGTPCTQTDSNNGACNCLYGSAGSGYCSSFCITGQAGGCPAGATCDALEYRSYGFSTANPGLGGYCTITCGGGSDGGTACPASTCTNVFAAGPDCIP
jgi:hypothetical protein